MAFYIVVKGHPSPFEFHYLSSLDGEVLERTRIHGSSKELSTPQIQSKKPLQAVAIMSKNLITTSPASRVSEVRGIMAKKKIHHLPMVVDSRLTGMISWHDIQKMSPDHELRAAEPMSKLILCASETTHIKHIAEVFSHENINSMPILDDELRLTGIITHRDLLKWMINFGFL